MESVSWSTDRKQLAVIREPAPAGRRLRHLESSIKTGLSLPAGPVPAGRDPRAGREGNRINLIGSFQNKG